MSALLSRLCRCRFGRGLPAGPAKRPAIAGGGGQSPGRPSSRNPQALSALLPQVTGSAQVSRERDRGSSNQVESVTVPGQPNFPGDFSRSRATRSPPIISTASTSNRISSAGKTGSHCKRADAQVAQAEADYQAAQQDLISRVAQALFRRARCRGRSRCRGRRSSVGESPARTGREALRGGVDRDHRRAGGTCLARQQCRRGDRIEKTGGVRAGIAARNHRRPLRYAGAPHRAPSSWQIRTRSARTAGSKWPCSRIYHWCPVDWRPISRART